MSSERKGTAVVTGGARGIGSAACSALAKAGFDLAIVSLETEAEAESILSGIRALGGKAVYFQRDIADIDLHDVLVHAVCEQVGPIDCLVNNAGVSSLRRDDMLHLSPASFDRSVSVNLRGTFFLTQAVAKAMIGAPARTTYRSIINVTSANAEILGLNRADYCMTKAALSMASRLFAARLAREGIHVFEVRPGIIRTDMTAPATERYDRFIENDGVPLNRWGTPDDVGGAIATIAQGGLPFDTGEVLNIGGGLHLHRV
jgi:NAD(P)-dependent dehydrogenase (short-subunit alcohol dehydrogenase family)